VYGCVGLRSRGISGRFGLASRISLLFEQKNAFFHLFTRLEGDDKFLGHIDAFAGARVTCFSGGTLLDLENAEIAQFDPTLSDQRINDGIERFLYDFLGLQLCETDFLGNHLNNFFLGHDSSLPREVPSDKMLGRRAMPMRLNCNANLDLVSSRVVGTAPSTVGETPCFSLVCEELKPFKDRRRETGAKGKLAWSWSGFGPREDDVL
jgi:hypothetical protein